MPGLVTQHEARDGIQMVGCRFVCFLFSVILVVSVGNKVGWPDYPGLGWI